MALLPRRPRPGDQAGPAHAHLLDFRPERPIIEAGLCNDINVAIYYIGSWLTGVAAPPFTT